MAALWFPLLWATTIAFSAVAASPCNPLVNATCLPNLGLPTTSYSVDFTKYQGVPPNWTLANYSKVDFGRQGASFTFAKRFDSPQLWTNFYFLFGRVDVVMQAAPGQGIISSSVLISDDLDEIDWEFSGGNFGKSSSPGLVQTNYFGKGVAGAYDRGAFSQVKSPQNSFHTYTVDWSSESVVWSIDGIAVRTLLAVDCKDNAHQFPQSPSKLQLGLWDGGDASTAPGTIEWAGGLTDLSKAPFTMFVKSVTITNANPALCYNWTDRSGNWGSIKPATGCSVPQGGPPGSNGTIRLSTKKPKTKSTQPVNLPTTICSGLKNHPTSNVPVPSKSSATCFAGLPPRAYSSFATTTNAPSIAGVSSRPATTASNLPYISASSCVCGAHTFPVVSGTMLPPSRPQGSASLTSNPVAIALDAMLSSAVTSKPSLNTAPEGTGSTTPAIVPSAKSASSSANCNGSIAAPTTIPILTPYGNGTGRYTRTNATTSYASSTHAAYSSTTSKSRTSTTKTSKHSTGSAPPSRTPSRSTSASRPAPTSSGLCPHGNLTQHACPNGKAFNIYCSVDMPNNDIHTTTCSDFPACINSCAAYTKGRTTCDGCVFLPQKSSCLLKAYTGTATPTPKSQSYSADCALKAGKGLSLQGMPRVRASATAGTVAVSSSSVTATTSGAGVKSKREDYRAAYANQAPHRGLF